MALTTRVEPVDSNKTFDLRYVINLDRIEAQALHDLLNAVVLPNPGGNASLYNTLMDIYMSMEDEDGEVFDSLRLDVSNVGLTA